MSNAIEISHLTKTFRLPHDRRDSLKEHLFNVFRPRTYEVIKAADDLSLEIKRGEFVGIIGPNGAGKSTLLKLIAGVLCPDGGKIKVNGRIAPFLELGVGFHPELTGRDNVFLYAALLGLSRREIKKRFDQIVAFAELERYLDQKLKNYSTGMQVRLAFAVTAHVDADILLVDEALAVGDEGFRKKCLEKFNYCKKDGSTAILVSHDLNLIEKHVTKCILVERGEIKNSGLADNIVCLYKQKYAL